MTWKSKEIKHKNEQRIAVEFPKNAELIKRIKLIDGSRWSASLKCWHIPNTKENRIRFKLETPLQNDYNTIKTEKINQFKLWLKSKRYSANTIKTYSEALKTFLFYFKEKSFSAIDNQDIILFNNHYIIQNNLSSSFQNQIVNAIKLFYKSVENKNMNLDLIHRPKREKTLPNVLSKEEVKLILTSLKNEKHRIMLSLIYACGLRRSELLNLKKTDILSDRMLIHIRQSKGKKDRVVPLSPKILEHLRTYYLHYRPKIWLFEGQVVGEKYSERSLELILKKSVKLAKIQKPATLHWLRHSYATHLLESGTDLRYIQELLGHTSSRTTEIYTHVSTKSIQQLRSPFDDL